MLTEVYVLRDSSHVYHYSQSATMDEDHFILSSGFLSALNSFAKETRSSAIDFFASKDEIFIYDTLGEDNFIIVCIFENKIRQSVAREIIHQIKEQMRYLKINRLPVTHEVDSKTSKSLSKKIEAIANSLISIDYQIIAAKEVFDEMPDLSFLLLYDYRRDFIHFYQPIPQDPTVSNDQLQCLRTIQRNMMKLVKGLDLGNNYRLVILQGSNYVIFITKYRTVLNVGYSKNPSTYDSIMEIPFQIMSLPTFANYSQNFESLPKKARWKLNHLSETFTVMGQPPYWNTSELLVEVLGGFSKLVETFSEDPIDEIQIFIEDPSYSSLRINVNHSYNEQTIDYYSA